MVELCAEMGAMATIRGLWEASASVSNIPHLGEGISCKAEASPSYSHLGAKAAMSSLGLSS